MPAIDLLAADEAANLVRISRGPSTATWPEVTNAALPPDPITGWRRRSPISPA